MCDIRLHNFVSAGEKVWLEKIKMIIDNKNSFEQILPCDFKSAGLLSA